MTNHSDTTFAPHISNERGESTRRQLHLGLMFWATGTHSAGWRHPLARSDGAFDIRFIQQMAQTAEQAKFDFLFLGDRLVADPGLARTNPGQMSRLEPFTVASAVAAATRRIGLVVTSNTTYSDPFTVARMQASLDLISNGRASWNIVTGADAAAAQNFSRDVHWDEAGRYEWATEFTEAALRLWDSGGAISPDAAVDMATAENADVDFEGRRIRIKGSLKLPRSPQGRPVLLHAGTSESSRELGARYADVLFSGHAVLAESKDYYHDIKTRALRYGRDPADIRIIPGLIVIAEETTEQSVATYDALNSLILIDPEDEPVAGVADGKAPAPNFQYVGLGRGAKRNLTLASEALGVDVRGNAHDALVPPDIYDRATPAGRGILDYIKRLTRRDLDATDPAQRITYLDLIHASIAQTAAVVGTPADVADYMQLWLDEKGADGFNIFCSFLPYSLDRFVELVVPELQRRGIYRTDYSGATFRDHLGIPLPA